jgi:hypothetical protein
MALRTGNEKSADVVVLQCQKLQLGMAAKSHCFQLSVSFHCTLHCYIAECCNFLSEFIFAFVFVDLVVENPFLTAVPFLMAVLLVVHFYCKEIVKDLKVSELHICL